MQIRERKKCWVFIYKKITNMLKYSYLNNWLIGTTGSIEFTQLMRLFGAPFLLAKKGDMG